MKVLEGKLGDPGTAPNQPSRSTGAGRPSGDLQHIQLLQWGLEGLLGWKSTEGCGFFMAPVLVSLHPSTCWWTWHLCWTAEPTLGGKSWTRKGGE